MASTTLESISEALQQVEAKKSNLKKAFEDLQSQSSLLSSFSLSWSDLDSHFTAIQTSLAERFRDLETLASQSTAPETDAEPAGPAGLAEPAAVAARPELVAFCEKMDGLGLRKYVFLAAKERNAVRLELPSAIRRSPDPAAMILDAMGGFFRKDAKSRGDKDPELSSLRRSCVILLEELMAIGAIVGGEVRERARALAAEWKKEMRTDEENPLASLGFLHLVAAFGLVSEFNADEIVDSFVVIAKYRQAIELFRKMNFEDNVEDLVNKLVSKGKQLLAIRFIFEFGLTDKFPPVPLLKTYVKESKKTAKKVCKEGKYSLKSQNEATAKEVGALRSVLKVIEENKLESEYPTEDLEKRIAQLEKAAADRKRIPAAPFPKPSNPQHLATRNQPGKEKLLQQSGNKRPRVGAALGPIPQPKAFRAANSYAPSYQHPHLQSPGLSADGSALYVSSSAAPYAMSGFVPSAAPHAGSSAGTYVLAGTQVGVPGNPSLASSHLYLAESYTPPAYYDRPTSHVGHGLQPQYHPSYYPQ